MKMKRVQLRFSVDLYRQLKEGIAELHKRGIFSIKTPVDVFREVLDWSDDKDFEVLSSKILYDEKFSWGIRLFGESVDKFLKWPIGFRSKIAESAILVWLETESTVLSPYVKGL